MSVAAAVQRLTRLRDALRSGTTLASSDATAIAAAIDDFLAGSDIAAALGVRAGRGELGWHRMAALDGRTAILREAAQRFYAGASIAEQARCLHTIGVRYQATGWRREESSVTCPARLVGRPEGAIWSALKAVPAMPSERALRRILGVGQTDPRLFGQRESSPSRTTTVER